MDGGSPKGERVGASESNAQMLPMKRAHITGITGQDAS
jgi:hypothetical protein